MKNILFGLLFLVAINISVSAASNGLYLCNDTVVGVDTLAIADTLTVDTLAVADTLTVDTLAVADTLTVDTLAVADTLSIDTLVADKHPVDTLADESTPSVDSLAVAEILAGVKSFFAARLDSIVAKYDTLRIESADGDESNPIYVRMFMRPTLYKSVLGKHYYKDIKFDDVATGTRMGDDAKRSRVIDGMLLALYKDNPSRVWTTEDELRKEISTDDMEKQQMSGFMLTTIQPIIIPENLEGNLATKVVKPNYWRTSGGFGINYTQNFYSDNWHRGGENTKNMLVEFNFKLKYDDKKKIQFENNLEAKLGFYTAPSDTVHSVKTNQDLLRFTSKLNYKGMKYFYYTVQAQVWTQFLPFYDANQPNYRSNFMAPFNANFSFGIDYKPTISKGSLSVYLAPLSAYNYRFVRYGDLAVAHFGIRPGRHHYEDFGTKLEVNATLNLLKNFSWKTRLYYYTTYSRVEHDWENTFSFSFNKYITAKMFVHSRFDDKTVSQRSKDYGYWQLYQNMMLGLTYTW